MTNLGEAMRKSLQDLPEGGIAASTRIMSMVSRVAAAIVVVYAVLTIFLGTLSMMSVPWSWTIGEKTSGTQVFKAQISTVQNIPLASVEKHLTPNCPELKKDLGQLSTCLVLPHTPTADEIATSSKAKQTLGNWFNAAIRPVFWSFPVFLLALGLIEAASCLTGLSAARYFDAATVGHLRNFAVTGLLYVLLTPLMPALANLFCTAVIWIDAVILKAWPSHRPYIFSMPTSFEADAAVGGIKTFSSFLVCLYAFTLTVIATVMAKASAIIEDHAEII